MKGRRREESGKEKERVGVMEEERAKGRTGAIRVCEILGAGHGGGRPTDQHFPQAWAQACENY